MCSDIYGDSYIYTPWRHMCDGSIYSYMYTPWRHMCDGSIHMYIPTRFAYTDVYILLARRISSKSYGDRRAYIFGTTIAKDMRTRSSWAQILVFCPRNIQVWVAIEENAQFVDSNFCFVLWPRSVQVRRVEMLARLLANVACVCLIRELTFLVFGHEVFRWVLLR